MKTKQHRLILAVVLLLTGITFGAETPDRIVEYKVVEGENLSLHIFNPEDHQVSDTRPAIVLFFGGGWYGGSPGQFYKQARYLASRGMVAICPEYRTKKSHAVTPDKCVMDGKSAVRWVRSHATELGIDPDRLAAGGGSAGGHVAATTATLSGLNEPGEDTSVSCVPGALVLFNPVFDNGPGGYGHDRVEAYWEEFSPLHNLHADTPPTTVFIGTNDKHIPVETTQAYQKKMEDLGRRCDLHIYEGMGHGFFNKAKFVETLIETDLFLTSLGYLTGEPTLSPE